MSEFDDYRSEVELLRNACKAESARADRLQAQLNEGRNQQALNMTLEKENYDCPHCKQRVYIGHRDPNGSHWHYRCLDEIDDRERWLSQMHADVEPELKGMMIGKVRLLLRNLDLNVSPARFLEEIKRAELELKHLTE